MSDVLALLLGGVLAHNLVFVHLCGLDAAALAARPLRAALALGLFTTLALALAAPLAWAIERHLLRDAGLAALHPAAALAASFAGAAALHLALRRAPPHLAALWQAQRHAVAPNAAVLGATLVTPRVAGDIAQALLFGVAAGLGFAAVLVLHAGLHDRLHRSAVPPPLRGAPLTLLTLALMALAFAGLSGLGRQP